MIDSSDIAWVKQALPFWDSLTDEQGELLVKNAMIQTFPRSCILHGGDQDCIGFLLIKSGRLRTYILSEEGRDITLYRMYEGNMCILSASCIIKQITFDVHIEAEEDSEILLISAATFSALSKSNVHVENFSYKLTADRFSDVMWAMQQILFMGFDKRLAVFLIDESAKTGSNRLKITHEQIAKYTGSAREVVTRMLQRFAQDGLVKLSRGEVDIVDKAGLRALL